MAVFLSLATYCCIIGTRLLRIICASNAHFFVRYYTNNVWKATQACSRRVVVL